MRSKGIWIGAMGYRDNRKEHDCRGFDLLDFDMSLISEEKRPGLRGHERWRLGGVEIDTERKKLRDRR